MKQFDIDEIKGLLEAYYAGNTSIEQEKLLCDFFATATNLPPELEPDRQLFVSLCSMEEEPIDVPADLESKLISHIDDLERAEAKKHINWVKPFSIISVAASVIVLFILAFNFFIHDGEVFDLNNPIATVEEEEAVMQETNESNQSSSDLIIDTEVEVEETIKREDLTNKVPVKNKTKIKSKKTKRVKHQRVIPNNHESVSEEQLAYENTERALLLLSEKLNKAQAGLDKTKTTINEVNNTIIDII